MLPVPLDRGAKLWMERTVTVLIEVRGEDISGDDKTPADPLSYVQAHIDATM